MQVFDVYSRPGCHLCERLVEELMPLLRGRGRVEIRNIDHLDAGLRKKYTERIPVVEYAGRLLCEFQLDAAAIESVLRDEGQASAD